MNKKLKTSLFLIPSNIADNDLFQHVSPYNIKISHSLKHFIVENARTARRYLKAIHYPYSFDEVWMRSLNEHNQFDVDSELLLPCFSGHNVGLLSEAGTPCVADPGYTIVRLAHQSGIRVVPLSGYSSIIQALMASGLNGQNFCFHGYLPVKPNELKVCLKKIEKQAASGQTQIFIETPYRNNRMLEIILSICNNQTLLCVATDISGDNERIIVMSISEWKKKKIDLKVMPSVFLLGM